MDGTRATPPLDDPGSRVRSLVHVSETGGHEHTLPGEGEPRTEGRSMDWRMFFTTFGAIFLAEMGDKTQLAALTLAAKTQQPWAVFAGASLALVAVSALGVMVGSVLGAYLPAMLVKRTAAVVFVAIGVLMLVGKL